MGSDETDGNRDRAPCKKVQRQAASSAATSRPRSASNCAPCTTMSSIRAFPTGSPICSRLESAARTRLMPMDESGSRNTRQILAAVPSLRAFAISLCGNVDRADDLVQETLLRALANINSFQPGTNMSAWLFTILRNHVPLGIPQAPARGRGRRRQLCRDPEVAAGADTARSNSRNSARRLASCRRISARR